MYKKVAAIFSARELGHFDVFQKIARTSGMSSIGDSQILAYPRVP